MPIKKLVVNENLYYEYNTSDEPLGVGGMGEVYKGRRCSTTDGERVVAIKKLLDDAKADTMVILRAKREASVRIKNANLQEMLDYIEIKEKDWDGTIKTDYYIVSELLIGVTLDQMLNGNATDQEGNTVEAAVKLMELQRTNPYRFAINIISSVLKGLIALHDAGYIHRDIDPTNIMVTTDGSIKLIDFGVAKKVKDLNDTDKEVTSVGIFIGKPTYASPEQVMGDVKHQNQKTDIYTLGALLFHLLVGTPPFTGAHHEVTNMHRVKKFPMRMVKQKAIAHVIEKASAKVQGERYPSAISMLADLEEIKYLPYPEPNIVNRYILGIGAASIAAIIIGLIVIFGSGKEQIDEIEAGLPSYEQAYQWLSSPETFDKGINAIDSLVARGDEDAMDLRANLFVRTSAGLNDKHEIRSVREIASTKNLKTDSIRAHELHLSLANMQDAKRISHHYSNLAEDYIKGIGCVPDEIKALQYIQKAMENLNGREDSVRLERVKREFDKSFSK